MGMRRQPVGDGIGRNARLIHLQENDFATFGRPKIVAAHGQLFGVNPVDFAVQDVAGLVVIFTVVAVGSVLVALPVFLFFIARKRAFAFLSRHRMHIEIMFADVGEPFAVRRKLRVFAGVGRRRKLHRGARIQAVVPELPLRIEEQMFGIGRPGIGGDVIPRRPLFLALVFDPAGGRRQLRKLDFAHQHFLLARHGVDIPELAVIAHVVALDE